MNQFLKYSKKLYKNTFYAKDLKITKTRQGFQKPRLDNDLKFGSVHTDHLLEMNWDIENGWERPVIVPYNKLNIDPRNSSLHYGIGLFDGMKAYKNKHNIVFFRPERHIERFLKSAQRIAMPYFEPDEFMKCLEEYLSLESDWIPDSEDFSLYVRPTFITTTNLLGIVPARKAKLYVFACPVSQYFKGGPNPISIVCSENTVRSWPGGYGDLKISANYAPTLEYQKKVIGQGFSQVLWLFEDNLTEATSMNLFCVFETEDGEIEVVTPPLDGLILPGITRDSVIEICKEWNIRVVERKIKIQELIEKINKNKVLEVFGTMTSSPITPVGSIGYQGKVYKVFKDTEQKIGYLGDRLAKRLKNIQYRKEEHKWGRVITNYV